MQCFFIPIVLYTNQDIQILIRFTYNVGTSSLCVSKIFLCAPILYRVYRPVKKERILLKLAWTWIDAWFLRKRNVKFQIYIEKKCVALGCLTGILVRALLGVPVTLLGIFLSLAAYQMHLTLSWHHVDMSSILTALLLINNKWTTFMINKSRAQYRVTIGKNVFFRHMSISKTVRKYI